MRCSKCAKRLTYKDKFCPKCGLEVPVKQRKMAKILAFTLLGILFLIIAAGIFFSYYQSTHNLTQHQKNIWLGSLGLAFGVFFIFCLIYTIYDFVIFIIKRPRAGLIWLAVLLIVAGSGYGLYYYSQEQKANKEFPMALASIQDSLVEVAAAKIKGDAIVAKKTLPGTSMDQIKATADLATSRFKFMLLPKSLDDYREAIIAWCEEISKSTEDTKTWGDLKGEPRDFKLILREKQAGEIFGQSVEKISELKEFGDLAVKNKDRAVMVYIASRLVVQEHWLKGVLHSETSGWFSLNPASPALALDVPDIGSSGAVPCEQVCAQIQKEKDAAYRQRLWNMYGCNNCGAAIPIVAPDQNQNQQNQQNQQQNQNQEGGQVQTGGQNQNQNQPGSSGSGQTQTSPSENQGAGQASQNQGGEAGTPISFSYGENSRKICIGRGGTDYRVNGQSPTDVYCVEDVLQSVFEIEASAVGFAKDDKGAKENWEGSWHNLEGMGVISQGNPDSGSSHSPKVQAFYDACQARGGIVGGAGTVKTGLPTTEAGYTCEYKNNNNQCWDYLTYSGGRYMGGNTGCPQQNLVPQQMDQERLKDEANKLGGRWDGVYAVGGGSVVCSGDFGLSIPIPAATAPVINSVLTTTQGPISINGNTAIWSTTVTTQQGEATVTVYEIDSFRFFQSGNTVGVSASYNGTMTAVQEDKVSRSVCSGSVGGARQ